MHRFPAEPRPPPADAAGLAGGKVYTDGTRSIDEPRVYLLGYGDLTGPASATLVGAGRMAKATVADITARLSA